MVVQVCHAVTQSSVVTPNNLVTRPPTQYPDDQNRIRGVKNRDASLQLRPKCHDVTQRPTKLAQNQSITCQRGKKSQQFKRSDLSRIFTKLNNYSSQMSSLGHCVMRREFKLN